MHPPPLHSLERWISEMEAELREARGAPHSPTADGSVAADQTAPVPEARGFPAVARTGATVMGQWRTTPPRRSTTRAVPVQRTVREREQEREHAQEREQQDSAGQPAAERTPAAAREHEHDDGVAGRDDGSTATSAATPAMPCRVDVENARFDPDMLRVRLLRGRGAW